MRECYKGRLKTATHQGFQTTFKLDRNDAIKDNPAIHLQPHRRHIRLKADLLGGDVYITARIPPVARHPRYRQPLYLQTAHFYLYPFRRFETRIQFKGNKMPAIRVKENEPFEVAMRRFKRAVEKTGLLTELRAREAYEKPTTERKRKKAAAVKRLQKRLRSQQLPPKYY